jgi:RNA ligase (TIGR02306 family)
MSTSKVWLTTINEVRPHPNADALDLATVHGWQMVVKRGAFQSGDPVLYFEQGLVLPPPVAETLGVTNYLAHKTDMSGEKVGVIHRVKLRGEPSFGLVVPATTPTDLLSLCQGVTKYHPPLRISTSGTLPNHPHFPPYTDIENLRSYPSILAEGEDVVITEKLHGTNCRVGFVRNSKGGAEWFAGSRQWQRVRPDSLEQDTYWFPLALPEINEHGLLGALERAGHQQAVLYGEVYGQGIQSYTYQQRVKVFRAFDLMIDGQYVNHDHFRMRCDSYNVPQVPVDYVGSYSLDHVKELSETPSLLGNPQGREGVVVKPLVERNDPTIGRVILKYVSDTYLFGKASAHDTTDA